MIDKGSCGMRKLLMVVVIIAFASFQKPVMAQEATSSDWSGAEIAALVIVGAAAAAVAWYTLGGAVVAGEMLAAEAVAAEGAVIGAEAAAGAEVAAGTEMAGGMHMAMPR
jgi:protein-S-isoprenylcysteine O-methyltransferase Ste14